MSSLILSLLFLPLSLSLIPPLTEQDDLFLNDFSHITPHPNQIVSFPQQNVAPATTQNEEFSIPEFPLSSKKANRQRVFHNGPPGFMPPKAVAKMREELTKDLDENHFGFVTRKGRARVLGISRRRPELSTTRHAI